MSLFLVFFQIFHVDFSLRGRQRIKDFSARTKFYSFKASKLYRRLLILLVSSGVTTGQSQNTAEQDELSSQCSDTEDRAAAGRYQLAPPHRSSSSLLLIAPPHRTSCFSSCQSKTLWSVQVQLTLSVTMPLFILLFLLVSHITTVTMNAGCHSDRDTDHRPRQNCTAAGFSSIPAGLEPSTQVRKQSAVGPAGKRGREVSFLSGRLLPMSEPDSRYDPAGLLEKLENGEKCTERA